MSTAPHEAMRRAIALSSATRPHPNPRVGAVVLDGAGRILSEGAHPGPGEPHAERLALDMLPSVPADATLVVTLEPCVHQGRTPPCSEMVIASGVRRVIVGALDPDPRVSGRGVAHLRSAGVEVEAGVLAGEVEAADPAYFHHRRHGRARITLKRAMTLDGQTAALDGTSQWITGPEAREDTHRLRATVDAVMVGAGTLRADDPRLTVRLEDYSGPQPTAVVVAGDGPLPARAHVWERPDTIVVATRTSDLPGHIVVVDKGEAGLPDMQQAVVELGERGLLDVLVEGGADLSASLWREGLVDRGVTYMGGMVAGAAGIPLFAGRWETIADGRRVEVLDARVLGNDIRIDWRPARE